MKTGTSYCTAPKQNAKEEIRHRNGQMKTRLRVEDTNHLFAFEEEGKSFFYWLETNKNC